MRHKCKVVGYKSCLASVIVQINTVYTVHILVIDIFAQARQDGPSQVMFDSHYGLYCFRQSRRAVPSLVLIFVEQVGAEAAGALHRLFEFPVANLRLVA